MIALQPYQQAAFLERFRRETDAIALLVHPNIVPVHEYGEQDGMAYLVMPYISGGTLRDELEHEGKLPLTQTVNYLDQMSAALHFAHERGIIHRDIKPANILLTPEKRLILTDFGLVKIISDEQRDQTPLSGPGMPMGTPDYMSPEQVLGGEIDVRADLYCLGVILYQMVTGVVPFKGEMPMKVAMHHLHTAPPSPRTFRPDLPASASDVILRALAKSPDDRYAHAHELALAFREALEAAGVVLADASGNTASIRTVKKDRTMSNRQRSLFDPLWRGDQSEQAYNQPQSPEQEDKMEDQPTNELPQQQERDKPFPSRLSNQSAMDASADNNAPAFQNGSQTFPYTPSSPPNANRSAPVRSSLLSRNRLRPEYQTQNEDQSINSTNNVPNPHTPQQFSPVASGTVSPAENAGLLRSYVPNGQGQGMPSMNGQSQWNGQGQGAASTMVPPGVPRLSKSTGQLNPPTPHNVMENWPNSTRVLGEEPLIGMPNAMGSNQPESSFNPYNLAPGTTGMLRTQTGALIPVSPPGATGAFMVPSGDEGTGQTGMLKLTQSVKVVRVPLAGQPGQYVTGLLPVVSSMREESKRAEPPEDTSLKGLIQKNMKVFILIAAVVVVLFGSLIFLVARPHSSTPTPGLTGNSQSNKFATVTAQANATAQANLIVADPLTSNIHGWPVGQNDTGVYTFDNGAYHIKATSDANDAVALLPNLSVTDKFVYTITLSEIAGLDNSTSANKVNTFGVLFRLSQPDDQHLSYYAFLINPNSSKPTYEFQKYDNSQRPKDPRTSLWTGDIGNEYHLDHNATNILKISANGGHFAFNVNGKDIATKDDSSLTAGQIGMIVNLRDTEIAFSQLLLTYH